ncbi:hypothetical protein KIKIMORA_02700 [Brevundimonas phage vB_BpoS-Kikimora]|uniref:Uncharacterized protein n=1 Tax=Brevundimonas phage vB_BpoS-Kikimora TaxID=2948601 RepID=A0A9E7SL47_9CAUD|nr:hypothetical protein KIKIMORA_02700 [Brevundimonas phage vB_BpoS-Kikimora]
MAKTAAARAKAAPANIVRGPARAESDSRSTEVAVPATPAILTPEDFRTIGEALNGTHWQADIAKLLLCSKSQVTRYLNKSRGLTPLVARQMREILLDRIAELAALLEMEGMPNAEAVETQDAIRTILTVCDELQQQKA